MHITISPLTLFYLLHYRALAVFCLYMSGYLKCLYGWRTHPWLDDSSCGLKMPHGFVCVCSSKSDRNAAHSSCLTGKERFFESQRCPVFSGDRCELTWFSSPSERKCQHQKAWGGTKAQFVRAPWWICYDFTHSVQGLININIKECTSASVQTV